MPPIEDDMLNRLNPAAWPVNWTVMAEAALFVGIAIAIALLLHRIAFSVLGRVARLSSTTVDDLVVERISRPRSGNMLPGSCARRCWAGSPTL
jgi:hypothetical protein